MKTYLIPIVLLICLIFGCSSDGDSSNKRISTDVTVIGSSQTTVYQADITNGEGVTVYNLTQELGLPDSNMRFYGRDFSPMFYFYQGPNIWEINKTWEKNLINGSHTDFNVPCNPMENRVSNGPVTYGDNIFWLKSMFEVDKTTISLEAFNRSSNECHSVILGTGFTNSNVNVFTFSNGKLLVSYTNDSRNTVLSKVNVSNYAIENQVIIEGFCGVTLKGSEMYCFLNSGAYQYLEYDFDTFQLKRSGNFSSGFPYFQGIIETNFEGNLMWFLQEAAQPAVVAWFPVVTDLEKASLVKVVEPFFIRENLQVLEGYEGASISNVKFAVDLKNEVVVGAFEYYQETTPQNFEIAYGIFFSDFDSNILKTVELDFQPGNIIIN